MSERAAVDPRRLLTLAMVAVTVVFLAEVAVIHRQTRRDLEAEPEQWVAAGTAGERRSELRTRLFANTAPSWRLYLMAFGGLGLMRMGASLLASRRPSRRK